MLLTEFKKEYLRLSRELIFSEKYKDIPAGVLSLSALECAFVTTTIGTAAEICCEQQRELTQEFVEITANKIAAHLVEDIQESTMLKLLEVINAGEVEDAT